MPLTEPLPAGEEPLCPACGHRSADEAEAPGWGRWRRCSFCSLSFVDPLGLPDDPCDLYEAAYRGEVKVAGMSNYHERIALRQVIVDEIHRPELGFWSDAFPSALDWIQERVTPGGCVFELGCASGYLLGEARLRGLDAVGLDVAATVVDLLRAEGFRVWHGELASLPHDFVVPDAVACMFVLHHLPDPLAFLREVRSRFPHAALALAVHGHDVHRPDSHNAEPPRTLTRWTTEALRAVLHNAGYDVEIDRCAGGPRQGFGRVAGISRLIRRFPALWLGVKHLERRLRRYGLTEPRGAVLLARALPRP